MTTKVILYFPSDATDKAVTYDLVKRYDLRINILRAEIEAGRSYPELIRYFTVFLKLMMSFTRNWKKF